MTLMGRACKGTIRAGKGSGFLVNLHCSPAIPASRGGTHQGSGKNVIFILHPFRNAWPAGWAKGGPIGWREAFGGKQGASRRRVSGFWFLKQIVANGGSIEFGSLCKPADMELAGAKGLAYNWSDFTNAHPLESTMNKRMYGILAFVGAVGAAWAAEPKVMNVQVRTAHLRATPSYLGARTASADYGDAVTLLQSEGEWRLVKSAKDGGEGWVHLSALSAKAIKIRADARDASTAASGEEMSLAGKGFNSEVEADFRSKNADIDFGPIDRMQERTIPTDEMIRFLEEGGVEPLGAQS